MNTCSIQVTQLFPLKETNLIGCNNAREHEEKRKRLLTSIFTLSKKTKNVRDDKTSGPNSVCLIN